MLSDMYKVVVSVVMMVFGFMLMVVAEAQMPTAWDTLNQRHKNIPLTGAASALIFAGMFIVFSIKEEPVAEVG